VEVLDDTLRHSAEQPLDPAAHRAVVIVDGSSDDTHAVVEMAVAGASLALHLPEQPRSATCNELGTGSSGIWQCVSRIPKKTIALKQPHRVRMEAAIRTPRARSRDWPTDAGLVLSRATRESVLSRLPGT